MGARGATGGGVPEAGAPAKTTTAAAAARVQRDGGSVSGPGKENTRCVPESADFPLPSFSGAAAPVGKMPAASSNG